MWPPDVGGPGEVEATEKEGGEARKRRKTGDDAWREGRERSGRRSDEVEKSEVGAVARGIEGERQGPGEGEMEVEGGDAPPPSRRSEDEFIEEFVQFLKVGPEVEGRPGYGRCDAGEAPAYEPKVGSLLATQRCGRPCDFGEELVRKGEESSCEGVNSARQRSASPTGTEGGNAPRDWTCAGTDHRVVSTRTQDEPAKESKGRTRSESVRVRHPHDLKAPGLPRVGGYRTGIGWAGWIWTTSTQATGAKGAKASSGRSPKREVAVEIQKTRRRKRWSFSPFPPPPLGRSLHHFARNGGQASVREQALDPVRVQEPRIRSQAKGQAGQPRGPRVRLPRRPRPRPQLVSIPYQNPYGPVEADRSVRGSSDEAFSTYR